MGREYTIGETAQLLNVTRDTLRFYEKKKLIVPRKEANGYRYYSGEDIQLLLDLIFLRKLQYSIQDIQLLCEDGDMDSMSPPSANFTAVDRYPIHKGENPKVFSALCSPSHSPHLYLFPDCVGL